MEKFVIIDGNSLINRAYYALPLLANFEGEVSNGVFGFCNILVKIINEVKPKYLAVAFDYGKKTFRNEMYGDYKGTRKPTPPQLVSQFPILKQVLTAMDITIIEREGVEADDIIGTLTKKFNVQNFVVTGDKDAFQLISENTSVVFTKRGISETAVYTPEFLLSEQGITPSQVIDLKALMGDASDNIPGVAGVGEKTAKSLIDQYKTLGGVYENVNEISGKLHEKLVAGKDMAYLSYELATIKTDCDLNYQLQDFNYTFPFSETVLTLFKKYQFNSLLRRQELFAGDTAMQNPKNPEIKRVVVNNAHELDKVLKQLKTVDKFAFLAHDEISLAFDNLNVVFNLDHDLLSAGLEIDELLLGLKPFLESEKVKKIVFDGKATKHKLRAYGISLSGATFDVLLARYLINNNAKSNVSPKELANEQGLSGELLSQMLLTLWKTFAQKLTELSLDSLYYDLELPLSNVLFEMEVAGFKIDTRELAALDERYALRIEQLTAKIYESAGVEFNVNSPKQLAEILFVKLGIKAYNNKKNSTGIDVLESIAHKHPIVPLIMEYRKVTKLYNTYIKAFGVLANATTHKIHTAFNQTNTATGRLSSNEPNLQNIPVRTEEGREFRKIFIPSVENGYIVTADYSQIELRLLASFSADEKMISAFRAGKDIHALTASEVFGVPLEAVSPQMRRDAKAINFGIIYGISGYGLSQTINSTAKMAADYIAHYFERYPLVKEYMDKNIEFCKEHGYVKTLLGRIRFINEIYSTNYVTRQFGERAAMNMPLQGSASDIIKTAMVKVFSELKRQGLKSKLILQIHDELLVDCAPNELPAVEKILKDCMENVVKLSVPLTVNIEHGKNWFEVK